MEDAKEVVKDICERYPQVEIHMKKRKMRNILDLIKNAQGGGDNGQKQQHELDIEMFKSALSEVDSQMKNLPATAQVRIFIRILFLIRIYMYLGLSFEV